MGHAERGVLELAETWEATCEMLRVAQKPVQDGGGLRVYYYGHVQRLKSGKGGREWRPVRRSGLKRSCREKDTQLHEHFGEVQHMRTKLRGAEVRLQERHSALKEVRAKACNAEVSSWERFRALETNCGRLRLAEGRFQES